MAHTLFHLILWWIAHFCTNMNWNTCTLKNTYATLTTHPLDKYEKSIVLGLFSSFFFVYILQLTLKKKKKNQSILLTVYFSRKCKSERMGTQNFLWPISELRKTLLTLLTCWVTHHPVQWAWNDESFAPHAGDPSPFTRLSSPKILFLFICPAPFRLKIFLWHCREKQLEHFYRKVH